MDKNMKAYDPYNFGMQPNFSAGPVSNTYDNYQNGVDVIMPPPNSSQISQYEQQYMYYRYLSQMMDYRIKSKEYERLSREDNEKKGKV